MPIQYPPTAPTYSGSVLQVHAFLKSPTAVQRRVRDLSLYAFVSDLLFPVGVEASAGAVSYTVTDPIVTDRDPSEVAPGGEYELALAQGGTPALAKAAKYGQDVRIVDEAIGRQKINAVEKAMKQSRNRAVNFIDTLGLAVASAAITQTQAASAAWSSATADPVLDLMLADAAVAEANPDAGFEPDLLITTLTLQARLVANKAVYTALLDKGAMQVQNGEITMLAGKRIVGVPAARMPAGTSAMLVDTSVFGSHGYEVIPSPEYTGGPDEIQTWVRRDPAATDSYLLRNRRSFVPIVEEPTAAIKITGV